MSWLVFAISAAIALGVHITLHKATSQYFTPLWAGMLYNGIIVFCYLPFAAHAWHQGDRPVFSMPGVWSVLALGASGALFIVLYQYAFRFSPSPSMVVTIADAGAVVVSVSLAALIFHDAMTPLKLAGIGMAVSGVILALKG